MRFKPVHIAIVMPVPITYIPGDYVRLYHNSGSGAIDWDNAADNGRHELYEDDAGVFGWGHFGWGHGPWGHAEVRNVPGWGHFAWGHGAWGHGSGRVTIDMEVEQPGNWIFGLAAYDAAGNAHVGTPDEESIALDLTPQTLAPLQRVSYDSGTNVLTLGV